MAKISRAEIVDYVAKIIKSKPDTSYADIVKEGKKDGYHVYPLIVGSREERARNGPPRSAAPVVRGPRARPSGRTRRGRGRPPMARGITGELVRGIERMQNDVAAMRSALHDIARLAARF